MTATPLLIASEIEELESIYLAAWRTVEGIRASHELGRHVQRPKLPHSLTESIVALAAGALFGHATEVRRGGRTADLLISLSGDARPSRVAVKGTGPARWITLTESDRSADILVWLDYAKRIRSDSEPIHAYRFEGPIRAWQLKDRVTLARVLATRPRVEQRPIRIYPRTLSAGEGRRT